MPVCVSVFVCVCVCVCVRGDLHFNMRMTELLHVLKVHVIEINFMRSRYNEIFYDFTCNNEQGAIKSYSRPSFITFLPHPPPPLHPSPLRRRLREINSSGHSLASTPNLAISKIELANPWIIKSSAKNRESVCFRLEATTEGTVRYTLNTFC